MRSWTATAMLAAMLGGCGADGGGEDFSLQIDRPVDKVLAAFGKVNTSESALVFSGMKIDRSKPSDREILYTIPASGGKSSTVRLSFEEAGDGKATLLHAFVDVPPVVARIDGMPKVVSENKVEAEIEKVLRQAKASLESGGPAGSSMTELSAILVGVAIATDTAYLAKAQAIQKDPEQLSQLINEAAADEDFAGGERESGRSDGSRWGSQAPSHESASLSREDRSGGGWGANTPE